MEELNKLDKKFRNISIIIIVIAIFLLILWVFLKLTTGENSSPLLISIAIALLLAGILLFTRIQYVIWMKKKY